ncbi:MAG: hypothetical protein ACE5JX_17475 [Acidobacteriota bacterium]
MFMTATILTPPGLIKYVFWLNGARGQPIGSLHRIVLSGVS